MAVMNALERIRDGASIEAVAAESGIPSSTLQTRWDEFVLSQQDEE
jgi:hypothetical protein